MMKCRYYVWINRGRSAASDYSSDGLEDLVLDYQSLNELSLYPDAHHLVVL